MTKRKTRNMPQYRGHSGYVTGTILVAFGMLIFALGGNFFGVLFVAIGTVIWLDYFLIKVFLKQTSHNRVRKR